MISAGEEKCYNLTDDTTIPLWSLVSMVLLVLSSSPPIHSSLSLVHSGIQQILTGGPGNVVITGPMHSPHGVCRLMGEVDIKHILPQMSFYHCDKSMKIQ